MKFTKVITIVSLLATCIISCTTNNTNTNNPDKPNSEVKPSSSSTPNISIKNKDTFIKFLECAMPNAPDSAKLNLRLALNTAKTSPVEFPQASIDDSIRLYGTYCPDLAKIASGL